MNSGIALALEAADDLAESLHVILRHGDRPLTPTQLVIIRGRLAKYEALRKVAK